MMAPWKIELRALRSRVNRMKDIQVFALACLHVSLAGERAEEVGRDDIMLLCAKFAHDMHDLAGTPELTYTARPRK